MWAHSSLPGSSYFRKFHGTRKECEAWLDKEIDRLQNLCGGLWDNVYCPAIFTDKVAAKIRYQDGRRVFEPDDFDYYDEDPEF
jgi:hypothetical protein